jgi:tRNA A-37 threonylcarbamoyl transferase component Bud32
MLIREGLMKIRNEFQEKKEAFLARMDSMLEDINEKGFNIGEGKTAEVKFVHDFENYCVKIVDRNRVLKNQAVVTNNVNEEIDFLDHLSADDFLKNIDVAEDIVPTPMMSIERRRFGFLFLQEIQGLSVEDYLNNRNLEKMPVDFDWIKFFDKLEDIVNKINKAGIFHRDLHAGNIMINEDGLPILIDFGNAYKKMLTDEDPYREEIYIGMKTQVHIYKSDVVNVKNLREQILLTLK